ncbi:MAG: hypothetical protein LV479_11020 [Methylacidiphilales bacterium]|nr:hypothetical protein [Candidatus Methylacidiphilales bacterium]
MIFATPIFGRRTIAFSVLAFGLVSLGLSVSRAQTNTTLPIPSSSNLDSAAIPPTPSTETNESATNAAPAAAVTPVPTPVPTPTAAPFVFADSHTTVSAVFPGRTAVAAFFALLSLGGFLLYQSGLTRAKNCGHAATLLLAGTAFAFIGYWIGGFAVQMGGVGDTHAALAYPLVSPEKNALDHELGFLASGHHWGVMGNSGFFLMTDLDPREAIAVIFLAQAAMLLIAVAAALGAALERGRILSMIVGSFLTGVFIYPFVANWIWGGGWLAELGREFGLGHGFIDLGGAGVVHETAGTLALVIALLLGARKGRFDRHRTPQAIPGHNMPFVVFGTLLLLVSWTAINVLSNSASWGLAALNTLLAAAGGLFISFLLAALRKLRPEPAILCRGLLGGAVASSSCGGLIDPWAAFVIGIVAGIVVQIALAVLDKANVDDPSGAVAVHGAAGAWGVLAMGLFANGIAGPAFNDIDGPIRGLFFGGAAHQLAAQAIGCVTIFVVVFILGFALLGLTHRILGNRVDATDEAEGLDWSETGVLGYQGDTENSGD